MKMKKNKCVVKRYVTAGTKKYSDKKRSTEITSDSKNKKVSKTLWDIGSVGFFGLITSPFPLPRNNRNKFISVTHATLQKEYN